ncbi:NAD(P)H-hydrate dehydratase [Candidatus Peregrinibacteria bacterium]|nr:NAD(P)H-hydrate dehydratase [Candidatus Peregrinibacteria bacterium]
MLPKIPKRKRDTNKGDYGKVLVVAGSVGMAGAAYLAASGAHRAGAGLVYLATPKSIYNVLAKKLFCTVIHPMPQTPRGALSNPIPILELTKKCGSAAIGPGISHNPKTAKVVRTLISKLLLPFVLDADGLNCISNNPSILRRAKAPIVITPHPGELSRLIKTSVNKIQRNRQAIAIKTAKLYNVIVLLKGHNAIVTDGKNVYVNKTGNPGMATGGSGDILTGIIATFLAQGFSPFDSACLGAHIHGLAGDLACKKFGETSLIATDILNYLPDAFKRYSK